MPKPVIFSVDDEPQVLNALERDLRQHFQDNYRLVKAGSGRQAIDAVYRLKERNDQIALFIADQRMPDLTGIEFLTEARKLYPEARKVLLTAYADTEAAISSINTVGLDYYFLKPWHPPEQRLYPVLDDLLSDWLATVGIPYDGIRVVGTSWSSSSHTVKDFLARNRIPYQWMDIEKDSVAAQLIAGDDSNLPVVFLPDGRKLVQPTTRELADCVGLRTQAADKFYDVVIVGGGPAGLGAAVYAATEGLRIAMVEVEATGGQAGSSSRIENYLGFPSGISGTDLAQRAALQAQRFGAEILTTQSAERVRVENSYRIVDLDDGSELSCRALIVATGMTVRKLDAPGADPLVGAGIYYGAAATEAATHRGQPVVVVGGANSAGQGAVFLSRYASKVTIVIRGNSIEAGMSHYLIGQIRDADNIEVLLEAEVAAAHGDRQLEAVTVRQKNEERTIPAGAMFVFIGAAPHSELLQGVVELNSAGFILTGPDLIRDGKRPKTWTPNRDPYPLETSVPGIFAAGDVRNGAVRRVAAAVGEGGVAITLVHQYLATV
jgi:thioredoxin reductase (NADPH)